MRKCRPGGSCWATLPKRINIQNPEITVKDVAVSAIRDIVGQSNIQPLLTGARQKTEQAVQKLMQDVLDSYGAGVSIDQVQLQKVDPPTT
jgi:membrane protease subunit HflK